MKELESTMEETMICVLRMEETMSYVLRMEESHSNVLRMEETKCLDKDRGNKEFCVKIEETMSYVLSMEETKCLVLRTDKWPKKSFVFNVIDDIVLLVWCPDGGSDEFVVFCFYQLLVICVSLALIIARN